MTETIDPQPALVEVTPTICVASDNVTDAELVKKLLGDEFENVLKSTNTDQSAEDFDRQRPNVLILVFNTLEKSQRYYLGLFRRSRAIHLQPHRTVILCNKDEVRRTYALCRDGLFDDYVLFWPVTNDAPRLPMTVHQALHELNVRGENKPSAKEFAAQARRLAELETLLENQMAQGNRHIEDAGRAMQKAEQDIGTTLDGFSQRLIQGALPDAVTVNNPGELEKEISRLKQGEIQQRFHTAALSAQPLKHWANEFKQQCAPFLESARALNTLAQRIQSTVLVVDDDEFQRKLVNSVLAAANYQLVFASNGVEALSILRKLRPDLILMDVMMPDMDGLEVTRQIKAAPRLADIPVIMITGKSEKNTVTNSLKVGAIDFVVKPVVRDILIAKVARALRGTDGGGNDGADVSTIN